MGRPSFVRACFGTFAELLYRFLDDHLSFRQLTWRNLHFSQVYDDSLTPHALMTFFTYSCGYNAHYVPEYFCACSISMFVCARIIVHLLCLSPRLVRVTR